MITLTTVMVFTPWDQAAFFWFLVALVAGAVFLLGLSQFNAVSGCAAMVFMFAFLCFLLGGCFALMEDEETCHTDWRDNTVCY